MPPVSRCVEREQSDKARHLEQKVKKHSHIGVDRKCFHGGHFRKGTYSKKAGGVSGLINNVNQLNNFTNEKNRRLWKWKRAITRTE